MGIIEGAVETVLPFWISLPLKALGGVRDGAAWLIGTPVRMLTAAVIAEAFLAWHFQARAVFHADETRAQAQQFRDAQAKAQTLAVEAIHHEEAVYQAKAQEADNDYQTQLVGARADADRYIAAHRVAGERMQSAAVEGGPGPAPAAAEGGSAPVPAGLPTDAVMVSSGDVQACTDAVTYGVQAHDWAAGINP